MGEQIRDLDINKLTTSKYNPRLELGDLAGMIETIKRGGIDEPLIVRKKKDKWEIIIGERRYQSAKKAGQKTLPCIVRSWTDGECLKKSLIENIVKKDLTPIERASGLKYLMKISPEEFPSQRALGELFKKDESTISVWLSIIDFPREVQERIGTQRGQIDLESATKVMKNLPKVRAIRFIKKAASKNLSQEAISQSLKLYLNKVVRTGRPDKMYDKAVPFPSFFVGCKYNCKYCVSSFQPLMKRQPCELCKSYEPHIHYDRFWTKPSKTTGKDFLFQCDCGDISFADPLTFHYLITYCRFYGDRTFLIQSKNPACFHKYNFPDNVILGATIETNRDEITKKISKAPLPSIRFKDMVKLDHRRRMITIEPILKFDLKVMLDWIKKINPEVVYVGYDSHPKNKLDEPTEAETKRLIAEISKLGIEVRKKLIRPAWDEKTRGYLKTR